MKKISILYIAVSLCISFYIESFASQIFYKRITLENMIAKSNLIVAAKYMEDDTNPNHYMLFKVNNILKINFKPANVKDNIIVRAAGHKEGVLVASMGGGFSRDINKYEQKEEFVLTRGNTYLIFLKNSWHKKEFEFVAENGFIGTNMEEKIRNIIKNMSKSLHTDQIHRLKNGGKSGG